MRNRLAEVGKLKARWIKAVLIGILSSMLLALGVLLQPASVLIHWETASELDTMGFYLTRGEQPRGPFERITATLIPAQADALSGGKYRYTDRFVKAGQVYYYQLEAVSITGEVERFGPLVVQADGVNDWAWAFVAFPFIIGIISAFVMWRNARLPVWLGAGEVILYCENQRLLKTLKQHYGHFTMQIEHPVMQVDIECRKPLQRSPGDAEPALEMESLQIWHVMADGFDGQIDLVTRKAWLKLASAQEALDADFFLRVLTLILAWERGGMLLHAAAVERKGQAYVFFGHSGSGKTTSARISEEQCGATVLNDDLVVLMPMQTGWQASGTPFWNPSQVQPNVNPRTVSLVGCYRLVKDQAVFLEKVGNGLAVAEILACVPAFGRLPAEVRNGLWQRAEQLAEWPGIQRLHFRKDPSFWRVLDDDVDG